MTQLQHTLNSKNAVPIFRCSDFPLKNLKELKEIRANAFLLIAKSKYQQIKSILSVVELVFIKSAPNSNVILISFVWMLFFFNAANYERSKEIEKKS